MGGNYFPFPLPGHEGLRRQHNLPLSLLSTELTEATLHPNFRSEYLRPLHFTFSSFPSSLCNCEYRCETSGLSLTDSTSGHSCLYNGAGGQSASCSVLGRHGRNEQQQDQPQIALAPLYEWRGQVSLGGLPMLLSS